MENKLPGDSSYQGVGSFIWEIIKIIILAFVIIVPVRVFLFQPFFVQGASMEPNFEDGQYLIINEFGYKETDVSIGQNNFFTVKPFKEIKRQMVVVFRYPLDPSKFFIKRVIGLPGEKVQIKDGQVMIFNSENPNGFVLNEKAYLPLGLKTSGDQVVPLSNDQYFVMGDNRPFSSDSRVWGTVPQKDIVGEVLLRAWPLNRISVY
jgi:signal peptidase I